MSHSCPEVKKEMKQPEEQTEETQQEVQRMSYLVATKKWLIVLVLQLP